MPANRDVFRLAYFVSHPIQYQVPLLRLIAADPGIRLKVIFYSDLSLRASYDRGFGRTIQWDTPLTGGYDFQVLSRWKQGAMTGQADRPSLPAKAVGQALDQEEFDAVWVHGWGHVCSWQAMLAAHRRGLPLLMRGESHQLAPPAPHLRRWLKRRVLSGLFRRISAFLTIGTLNREFYLAHGVPAERLFDVPYSVDNAEFQRRSDAVTDDDLATVRRQLDLDPARPVILFTAKLLDVKNPLGLLAAYRLLGSGSDGTAEPEPYLLYVGEGARRTELERGIAATGWKSIRLLGFRNQSELPALYRLSDVFVLPSLVEPWGLVVNEAMNAGCAVVISDRVGCAPDLVEDGVNGKVYPANDARALADALRWGLANARSAGEASRRKIDHWSYREDLAGLKQALGSLRPRGTSHR